MNGGCKNGRNDDGYADAWCCLLSLVACLRLRVYFSNRSVRGYLTRRTGHAGRPPAGAAQEIQPPATHHTRLTYCLIGRKVRSRCESPLWPRSRFPVPILDTVTAVKTAHRVFKFRLGWPSMTYTVYLLIAPVLAYLLYEDWKDGIRYRDNCGKK